MTTQEKLLLNARRLFWTRGYSNVSVRQVATAAGVDVALISRYFGGKRGLFDATVDGVFEFDGIAGLGEAELIDLFLKMFVEAPRDGSEPSTLRLLLTNAHDEYVGTDVRDAFRNSIHRDLVSILQSEERAALFTAVLLGMSVAEKSLRLPGIGTPGDTAYETQLLHLMRAALRPI